MLFCLFGGISSYAPRKWLTKGLKMELPEDYGSHCVIIFFYNLLNAIAGKGQFVSYCIIFPKRKRSLKRSRDRDDKIAIGSLIFFPMAIGIGIAILAIGVLPWSFLNLPMEALFKQMVGFESEDSKDNQASINRCEGIASS